MCEAILDLRRLSAGYSEEPVVTAVSLELPPASITTIIGANGAGKSTLLKAIYGLIRRLDGSVRFLGQIIDDLDPAERLARGIGFVPQGRCNFPRLSVRENLELGGYTLSRVAARTAIERVVAQFPLLSGKWRELAGNLSGGEQQILEMAMVLETAPKLLLLDEPSLGLAPKVLAEVFEAVQKVRLTGVSVLIVEQNVRAALAVSDTAVVIELGRKVHEGPAQTIMADERVRVAYLGSDKLIRGPTAATDRRSV
jgi:branched-chain amino acid transport system ATP-binding protein